MVIAKSPVMAPLETIYEESGSYISSIGYPHHRIHNNPYTNGAINGLISARSIPAVNIHRQRACENQMKPPIEVRLRNGSIRYIHPSTDNTMMVSRRKFCDSSEANLSSNTMPNFKCSYTSNTNAMNTNTIRRRPPIVITIITAKDIKQAGFTPTDTSSPDTTSGGMSTPSFSKSPSNISQAISTPTLSKSFSNVSQPISSISQPISSLSQRIPTQQSILIQSQSSSTVGTAKTKKGTHKVSFAPSPPMTPVQSYMHTTINQSVPNTVLTTNLPLRSPQHSIASSNSRNSTPSQSTSFNSNSLSSTPNQTPNPRSTNPSLQLTLTNNTNNRNISLNNIQTINQGTQPNTIVAIGGGSHSAFRPFLKQIRLNQKSSPITKRLPMSSTGRMYRPTQQQMLSYVQNYRQKKQHRHQPTISSTNMTNIPVNSYTTENEDLSNYQQQLVSSNSSVHNSLTVQNLLNMSTNPNPVLSVSMNPDVGWHNITSNNVYDIPQLARRYAGIPLRIDLPVSSPNSNQKSLIHHNTALEQRLLNAGLSPETVALYERILDAAQNRPISVLASSNAIDQYPYNSLI